MPQRLQIPTRNTTFFRSTFYRSYYLEVLQNSNSLESIFWDRDQEFEKFEDDSVFDDAVKRGSYILAYSKTVVKKVCDKASERYLDGKHVMVVNASHWMSEIGARLSPDCDHHMMAISMVSP